MKNRTAFQFAHDRYAFIISAACSISEACGAANGSATQSHHHWIAEVRHHQPVLLPLYYYLSLHPEIFMSGRFDDDYIVMPSRQCLQLELYLQYYLQAQILVLTQEELERNRAETLRRVFRFLEVDDSFESPKFSRILNESKTTNMTGRSLMKAIERAGVGSILPSTIKLQIRKPLLCGLSRARSSNRCSSVSWNSAC